MATYTYNFTDVTSGLTSNIVVTAADAATDDSGYGTGYNVTDVSGTFEGMTITGELGVGGALQSDNYLDWDNVVFVDDHAGFYNGNEGASYSYSGTSYYGVDELGIAFTTSGGKEYDIIEIQPGGPLVSNDGSNVHQLNVTSSDAPCYCPGGMVLTEFGDIALENLRIGDNVVTASGAVRPIKWIGMRAFAARFARNNADAHPVCFKAGSLGDHVPTRDLWVSPHHAMFLDGVLIPAECLVNGLTVVQPLPHDDVRYFHVELASHDILVVNGAASESFLDDGSRAMFQNAATYATLYPGQNSSAPDFCAPRVEDGHAFERVRRRLAQRAGLEVAPEMSLGALEAEIERLDATGVSGWARNAAAPDAAVCLDVRLDGALIAYAYADTLRGEGGRGFQVRFAAPLDLSSCGLLEVRRSADGARLAA